MMKEIIKRTVVKRTSEITSEQVISWTRRTEAQGVKGVHRGDKGK